GLAVRCLVLVCVVAVCRCLFFFFFQAEDGIRDWSVTGVQTCALPIFRRRSRTFRLSVAGGAMSAGMYATVAGATLLALYWGFARSEERRVGKEGRSRWGPEH